MKKMAVWVDPRQWDLKHVCVARGIVSWGSKDNDEPGELQLWKRQTKDKNYIYCINARKRASGDLSVCKVIVVFTVHFQKYTNKIKTLLTKKSKFHFVQF